MPDPFVNLLLEVSLLLYKLCQGLGRWNITGSQLWHITDQCEDLAVYLVYKRGEIWGKDQVPRVSDPLQAQY